MSRMMIGDRFGFDFKKSIREISEALGRRAEEMRGSAEERLPKVYKAFDKAGLKKEAVDKILKRLATRAGALRFHDGIGLGDVGMAEATTAETPVMMTALIQAKTLIAERNRADGFDLIAKHFRLESDQSRETFLSLTDIKAVFEPYNKHELEMIFAQYAQPMYGARRGAPIVGGAGIGAFTPISSPDDELLADLDDNALSPGA
jgi:hypothetical protein